jgi:hypothetical protein
MPLALPSYEIWLTDDFGVRLAQITTFSSLAATRTVNAIGWLDLVLPPSFDTSLIKPDRMIQVWRAPRGGVLSLWRVYFIRRKRWQTTGGDETLIVSGPDSNDLLRRRIVAAYSGSAQAKKIDVADDMIKEYVTESLLDNAEPTPDAGTRVWADLSIAADLGDGPTLTKSANFGRLLQPSGGGLLADLSKASFEAGEVFFDVVPNSVSSSSIDFQFRTYTGQPGMDVSDRVVFDQQRGNLADPFLEYDYSEEVNYVYAGGQGDEDARNIQQVYDADRYNVSQWNRCEAFADARQQTTDDGVREVGRARLMEGRPKRRAGGTPLDSEGTRFGIDWDVGYKVREVYRDEEFDAIVRSVVLTVTPGGEAINARLEYEE